MALVSDIGVPAVCYELSKFSKRLPRYCCRDNNTQREATRTSSNDADTVFTNQCDQLNNCITNYRILAIKINYDYNASVISMCIHNNHYSLREQILHKEFLPRQATINEHYV